MEVLYIVSETKSIPLQSVVFFIMFDSIIIINCVYIISLLYLLQLLINKLSAKTPEHLKNNELFSVNYLKQMLH